MPTTRKLKRKPLFERLLLAGAQLQAHAEGKIKLRVTTFHIAEPPPAYSSRGIRDMRNRMKLREFEFARMLNVSERTLAAWESGKSSPSAPALRLLQILDNPELVHELRPRRAA